MCETSNILAWEKALQELDTLEKVDESAIKKLSKLFLHLPPYTVPRLQKTYETCTTDSFKILNSLFDKIDISDKKLLNLLLNLYHSFGYFKIAQITYHIESASTNEYDRDPNVTFEIEKCKWYDLRPLLPPAGDLGWKHVLNHGLVIEEPQLLTTCLHLLVQKLHFYAIISMLDRFESSSKLIHKNGAAVSTKLCELILDFANDDDEVNGLNPFQFNLISLFVNEEQQASIINGIICDRFKPRLLENSEAKNNCRALSRIHQLIDECIMGRADLQFVLITKLLEHLKLNVIRRKRRHSVEIGEGEVSLETLIADIIEGVGIKNLLEKIHDVRVSSKRLQSAYVKEWICVVDNIVTKKTLSTKCVNMILSTCSMILITMSDTGHDDLMMNTSLLMTKILDNTGRMVRNKFFEACGPQLLMELSKNMDSMAGALVSVLNLAIMQKDRETLDTYGELLSKLYKNVTKRVETLVVSFRTGASICDPLDSHLNRLMTMYTEHKNLIQPYLTYDLNQEISNSLLLESSTPDFADEVELKRRKKAAYNQVKTKLESLQERAEKSENIYGTIINRQYSSVVDQTTSCSNGDTKGKNTCWQSYRYHTCTLGGVASTLLNNCDDLTYKSVLENIVGQFELCDPLDHPKVLYIILMLESLIPKDFKEMPKVVAFGDILTTTGYWLIRVSKSVELGPSIYSFSNSGSHKSSASIQCCTYANCIRIYSLIYNRFPSKITNSMITDAMQLTISSNMIRYAKNSLRSHGYFLQLASAIADLLRSIRFGRKEDDTLKTSMPIFISVLMLLVRSVIIASDRQKIEQLNRLSKQSEPITNGNGLGNHSEDTPTVSEEDTCNAYETHLEFLARDIGRVLNNLSYLEVRLIDYAPHLISTYVKDTQRASCPNSIRKHLDEGIFRIFNLVDAYQKARQQEIIDSGLQRKTMAAKASGSLFEMIHARLDQASREIFRNLHENYNKFHRYQGKC